MSNLLLTAANYIAVMRFFAIILAACIAMHSTEVMAGTSDAREVARINNCPPKKVEVYQQSLGIEGNTVYRIECNLPKAKNENAPKTADAVLIQCTGSLCSLLRPINTENK